MLVTTLDDVLSVGAINKVVFFGSITDYLTDVYGNLAMVNYPYESSFLAPLPAYPVEAFCAYLNESLESTQLIDVSGASRIRGKKDFK